MIQPLKYAALIQLAVIPYAIFAELSPKTRRYGAVQPDGVVQTNMEIMIQVVSSKAHIPITIMGHASGR